MVSVVIGVAGVVCALIIPFAPVWSNTTLVTWPAQGQAPASTTALFSPAKPAELHAVIPCAAVQAGLARPGGSTVLATDVPGRASKGLAVIARDGGVRVLLGGFEALSAPVAATGCDVQVDVAPGSTRVAAGGHTTELHGAQYVPEVHAFVTELTGQQAHGVQVTARPHVWFENSPSGGKIALIAAQLLLAVAALAILARRPRASVDGASQAPAARHRARWLVDVGMLGVLGYWTIVGPLTDDDGFSTMTVRNGLLTGDIGNYYRWLNGSEAPFTLLQTMLEPLVAVSLTPPILRLPSVAAGIALWFVVSRGVLGAIVPAISATWWARLLTAVALMTWWLPFNLGVRSEPFVALGSAIVLALLLRGTAPGRRNLLSLGVAALVAGLSLAFNPTGLIAWVPIVVLAPRIVRTLRNPDGSGPGWLAGSGRLALLVCLASTALVVMFADQSLFGVLKATEIHSYYGPSVPWYMELTQRYDYLLGYSNEQGAAVKRLPVLLTVAMLVPVVILISRGGRAFTGVLEAHVPAMCFVLGMGVLWVTPSKWSHHFGALAGVGSVFLVVAVVLVVSAAWRRSADRVVVLTGVAGTVLGVVATAYSFSGKNDWYSFSEFGLPWVDGPITPFNRPLTWLVALAIAGLVLLGWTTSGRRPAATAVRTIVSAAPALLVILACTTAVGVLLGSFTAGAIRQKQIGSYSLAQQNVRHLLGHSCGIVDNIVAAPDVPGGALAPLGPPGPAAGFAQGSGYSPAPGFDMRGVAGTSLLWGSNLPERGAEQNTGALTTQWFGLPAVGPHRDLAVSVAGRTGDGNRVTVEFARGAPGAPEQPLGERVLDDSYKDEDKQPMYPTLRVPEVQPQNAPYWRALWVTPEQIPPGANLVRVHAVDATSDTGGWVAVTQPRLRDVVPLKQKLDAPVMIATELSWSMPCVRDVPRVEHGLVQTPKALVLSSDGFNGFGGVPFDKDTGGTFTGLPGMSSLPEIPTRLAGPELIPKHNTWGHLVLVDPVLKNTDAYTARTTTARQWGWEGDR